MTFLIAIASVVVSTIVGYLLLILFISQGSPAHFAIGSSAAFMTALAWWVYQGLYKDLTNKGE